MEQVISGVAALIKETGWKPEYIIWELPCAWFFLLIDFWPSWKKAAGEEAPEMDISEFTPEQLQQLGLHYGNA